MSIYDSPVTTLDGRQQTLAEYRGRVLLVVNVASKCYFTRQYAWLEDLHRRYADKGFAVLGFPCNQFGQQEPGDPAAIQNFCSLTFNVSFPLFAKVEVNGKNAHPLFQFLKDAKRGTLGTRSIKWNFTKFLVGRDGEVLKRYGPAAGLKRIERDVAELLALPT